MIERMSTEQAANESLLEQMIDRAVAARVQAAVESDQDIVPSIYADHLGDALRDELADPHSDCRRTIEAVLSMTARNVMPAAYAAMREDMMRRIHDDAAMSGDCGSVKVGAGCDE